jgi:hypothetical protein
VPVWYIVFQGWWRKNKKETLLIDVNEEIFVTILYFRISFSEILTSRLFENNVTIFLNDLKTWFENLIYIDLEIKICSKEYIALLSILITPPHPPRPPTTQQLKKQFHWYSRRNSKYPRKSGAIIRLILGCVWESIYRKAFIQL